MVSPEERYPNPAFHGPAINNPSYRWPMPSPSPRLLDFSSPKNRTNPSLYRRGVWTETANEPRNSDDEGELIKIPEPKLSIPSTRELKTEVDTEEGKRDVIIVLHRSSSINIKFKTPYSLVFELETQTCIATGIHKSILDLCFSCRNFQNSSQTCYQNNDVGCTANNQITSMDIYTLCGRHENYLWAVIKFHESRISRSNSQEDSYWPRNHQKIHELSCGYYEIVFLANPEHKQDSKQISMGGRPIQYHKFTVRCCTPFEIDYCTVEILKLKTTLDLSGAPWQTIAFSLSTLNEQHRIQLCESFALTLVLVSTFSQMAILVFLLYRFVVKSFAQQKHVDKMTDLIVFEPQITRNVV